MKQILTVSGMHCAHCAAAVKEALESAGAMQVTVDLQTKQVVCESDLSEAALRAALEEEDFTLEKVTTEA